MEEFMFDRYYKYWNQASLANIMFRFTTIQIYHLFVSNEWFVKIKNIKINI